MSKFFNMFGRFWIWCMHLFGSQNHTGSTENEVLTDVSNFMQILQIMDVTTNTNDFLSKNLDFYRNMSSRHGSPDYVLNWHLMSGAATYIPTLDVNILFERLFYSLDPGKGHRSTIDKSFLVYTAWAKNWSFPVAPTQLFHVNETAGSLYADDLNLTQRVMEGPEDPRVIYNQEKDEISLNFNAMTPIHDRQMFGNTIRFTRSKEGFDYEKTENLIQFQHPNGYRAESEKNWVPIIIKGELHYIYSLSPLRILKCDVQEETFSNGMKKKQKAIKYNKDSSSYKKTCRVKFKGEEVNKGSQTCALRSGTNWIEYSPGVYFSFARTRIMHQNCPLAIYRPNLVVLKFNIDAKTGEYTEPHILSVSKHITEFDSHLFEMYGKKRLSSGQKCDDEAVLTPGSISNWTGVTGDENSDIADVIISVNDDMTVLVKIKGFGRLVQDALDSAPTTKQALSISKKGTLADSAEREMKKFIEESFSKAAKEN